jgi:hypothetical protein
MSDSSSTPAAVQARPRGTWAWALALGLLATASFAYRLAEQPHFVDESAYISQSYYLNLLARPNDRSWLEYPAFDLPPLPKYMIGAALLLGDQRIPGRADMKAWYMDTSRRCETEEALWWARWPAVVLGGLGCAAIFGIGTLAAGRRVGVVAALLLMENPLYRMHARRAMSDVPAEALILTTLWISLAAWQSALAGRLRLMRWSVSALGMGVCGGLAVLAKLNGGLALMVLGAWVVLAQMLRGFSWHGQIGYVRAVLLAGAIAFATFVALNPFVWARPRERLTGALAQIGKKDARGRVLEVIRHRTAVSDEARRQFPRDALGSLSDKVKAVAVQGFGRFGPLGPSEADSRKRYDPAQDYGAPIWGLIVLAGSGLAVLRGQEQIRSRVPPAAWAVLLQAAVAAVTVTLFIPLAWDRYFLSLQPGFILLGSLAIVAALPRRARRDGSEP